MANKIINKWVGSESKDLFNQFSSNIPMSNTKTHPSASNKQKQIQLNVKVIRKKKIGRIMCSGFTDALVSFEIWRERRETRIKLILEEWIIHGANTWQE